MAERLAASRLAATPAGANTNADLDRVGLPSRILAYLIDSVVLFAFAMLFMALAGFMVYQRTDGGETGLSDADQWIFLAILIASMPAWLLLNLAIALRFGATLGQFMLGQRPVREDGRTPGPGRLLAYWLALHPLLFHPMFGGSWLILAWAAILSDFVLIGSLAVALLCLVAPLASLIFALVDPQRRTIHDRLAGIKIVRAA